MSQVMAVLLFLGVLQMKNIFKKVVVVATASLFVTGVFAAETSTTTVADNTKTVADAHAEKQVVAAHCVKHCHGAKNVKHCKKHCKKIMQHKKMMKKAEAPAAAAKQG